VSEKTDLLDFLANQLTDADTAWSLGTFGAIAEVTRDADETATLARTDGMISVVTARGSLRIEMHPALRPIASESLTSESRSHRMALCLPQEACATSGRSVLTEVGPDRDALRAEDRSAVLFDLGLGALQVDVCVRSIVRRTAIRRDQTARHRIRGGWSRAVCSLASGRQVYPSHRARRLAAVEGAGPDVAGAG